MKYNFSYLLIALLIFLGLSACKEEENPTPIWYLTKNYSDFDVTLKSTMGDPDIILKKGEIKDIPSNHGFHYDIVPNQPTTQIFEFFHLWAYVTEIYSYDYKLEYIIEGTTEKADIEFYNDMGAIETHKNVSLPAKYQFKTFCKCTAAASAKRVGDTGSIKISLYKRGRYMYSTTTQSSDYIRVELDRW